MDVSADKLSSPTLSPSPSTGMDRILPMPTSVRPFSLPLRRPPCPALSTATPRASPLLAQCCRCLQLTPIPHAPMVRTSKNLDASDAGIPSRGSRCWRCRLWWLGGLVDGRDRSEAREGKRRRSCGGALRSFDNLRSLPLQPLPPPFLL
jgi:hypothetical protein